MELASSNRIENNYLDWKVELVNDGLVVLPQIFSRSAIKDIRELILSNLSLLRNTRAAESSLHLAGFHRYPEFENLHSMLSCNEVVLGFLRYILDGGHVRNTGITDITINRSQCWHKDLLRGPYESLLQPEVIWKSQGEIFRIVVYLQDSSQLKIVPGSHREPISLQSDNEAVPVDNHRIKYISIKAGDVVVMDVRTTHRGADEAHFIDYDGGPSILVATTLGSDKSRLTDQLEYGNASRLRDWMNRNYYPAFDEM